MHYPVCIRPCCWTLLYNAERVLRRRTRKIKNTSISMPYYKYLMGKVNKTTAFKSYTVFKKLWVKYTSKPGHMSQWLMT